MSETLAARELELREQRGWLFKPLSSLITDPDSSPPVPFGLPKLDAALGGGLRRGFHLLAGYQHSGKTLLLLRMIWENRHKPAVIFTMDEDVDRVTAKLLNMATGEPIESLLEAPKERKQALIQEFFPKLAVDEEERSSDEMLQYLEEVKMHHDEPVNLVAYDFLEHFASNRMDSVAGVKAAAKRLKRMAKISGCPWVVIHQGNRMAADGKPFRAEMLAFGGEQDADSIIAVRQQAHMPNPPKAVLAQEAAQPSIHVTLGKNKQTYKYFHASGNSRGIPWSEELFAIDKETGMIRPFKPTERILTTTDVAWANNKERYA